MSKPKNFIVVHDDVARDDLIAAGFLIVEEGADYTKFSNPTGKKIKFEGYEEGSITYTNKLNV